MDINFFCLFDDERKEFILKRVGGDALPKFYCVVSNFKSISIFQI